jgi:hypothetical protein
MSITPTLKMFAPYVVIMSATAATVRANPTIDQMYVDNGYSDTYDPTGTGLYFLNSAHHYVLSDGTSWDSGAGTYWNFNAHLANQWTSGTTIYYELDFQPGDSVYRQTDYDSGDHSAQGELTAVEPIVLVAELGASTATVSGYVKLFSNEETSYGEPRFNYYSAAVGEWVPYYGTYTLVGGTTFTATTFQGQFGYLFEGVVDFENAIPEPVSALLWLGLAGLALPRHRRRAP